MNKPSFNLPIKVRVENHLNTNHAFLHSIDSSFPLEDSHLEDITTICNQDLVYDWLFNVKLEGQPYKIEKARSFAEYCVKGWEVKSSFTFWLIENDKVIAALDIKSADTDAAEVGYWADSNVPGYMTNTLTSLCEIAKNSGYKSLYTLIRPANIASRSLVERANFDYKGFENSNNKKYCKYVKKLI